MGDRRIVAMIDHLCLVEQRPIEGLTGNDLKPFYSAVASAGRNLAEAVCHHLLQLVEDSRFTHEASDVVNAGLVAEQTSAAAHEFTGPAT
jgi:hypothetical protein